MTLPEAIHNALRIAAAHRGVSITAMTRDILAESLGFKGKGGGSK